ncbi:MAG: polyprenyl synthetase family protein [Alistipes sp.]|nr:polyprenyl synthetase family protein [Alistipes sp.]
MKNNDQILNLFENYLAQIQFPEEPEQLYKPILYSMSGGGKRIRPTLLMLACEAFGGDVQQALPAAAAVEMFHNFTLLHDDIMDNAEVRRGKPSVYASWGNNVAILSGDAMMICSYRLLSKVPSEKLASIMEIFTTTALQVCEGQQYDMDFESRQKVSVVEYMNMIELKTSVLLAGAAAIGAVLGDASEEDCRQIYRYALELGLAFQLQDDLLDSYGTQEELGKRIGGDILEGKKTCLMLNAMSRATEEDREVLRSTYLNASLSDEQKIERVKAIYDKYDIPHLINQQISLRFDRALSILDSLAIPKERTEHLRVFAQNLMGRKK